MVVVDDLLMCTVVVLANEQLDCCDDQVVVHFVLIADDVDCQWCTFLCFSFFIFSISNFYFLASSLMS